MQRLLALAVGLLLTCPGVGCGADPTPAPRAGASAPDGAIGADAGTLEDTTGNDAAWPDVSGDSDGAGAQTPDASDPADGDTRREDDAPPVSHDAATPDAGTDAGEEPPGDAVLDATSDAPLDNEAFEPPDATPEVAADTPGPGDGEGADGGGADGEDGGACESPAPPPGDVPLLIGVAVAGGGVEALADGAPIEIVQGPQGGVHLEVAFALTLPEVFAATTAKVRVEARTFQPCCAGEPPVGTLSNAKYLAYLVQPGSHDFVSQALQVIFDETEASFYMNSECCVAMEVWATAPGAAEPTHRGAALHRFLCVDAL